MRQHVFGRKLPNLFAHVLGSAYDGSVNEQEEHQTRAWVDGWRESGVALDQVRIQELRALTEDESGRLFASMSIDTDTLWISPERRTAAGLVEQQRLFMLSDEHPTRHRRRS